MAIPKRSWAELRIKLFWGLVFSLPLGILASYLAGRIGGTYPELSVDCQSSQLGGQTVIDVNIQNTGDYGLSALRIVLDFEKSPTYAIDPREYEAYASLTGSRFILSTPQDLKLGKQQKISLRFTSRGANSVNDLNTLPGRVNAHLVIEDEIRGTWKSNYWFGKLDLPGIVLGLALIIIGALLGVILFFVLQLRRLAGVKLSAELSEIDVEPRFSEPPAR